MPVECWSLPRHTPDVWSWEFFITYCFFVIEWVLGKGRPCFLKNCVWTTSMKTMLLHCILKWCGTEIGICECLGWLIMSYILLLQLLCALSRLPLTCYLIRIRSWKVACLWDCDVLHAALWCSLYSRELLKLAKPSFFSKLWCISHCSVAFDTWKNHLVQAAGDQIIQITSFKVVLREIKYTNNSGLCLGKNGCHRKSFSTQEWDLCWIMAWKMMKTWIFNLHVACCWLHKDIPPSLVLV